MRTVVFIMIMQAFITTTINAQINTEDIQLVIKTSKIEAPLQYPEDIKVFYKTNGYNFVWVNNAGHLQSLLQLLKNASMLGLQEEDYQFAFIQSIRINSFISPAHNE